MPKGQLMHTHVSATMIATVFVGVLIAGTLWRLTAMHLSGNPNVGATGTRIGEAMAVQY